MTTINITKPIFVAAVLMLTSCSDPSSSGPDLSNISETDHVFYTKAFNQCNINNTQYNCNCVARVNVDHRNVTYVAYKSDYQAVHKPALEKEITALAATVAEKTKNMSDPRIIQSHTDDLGRLREQLALGVNHIDDFKMPGLPVNATSACVIN
ncbi:MAG: hypothetical protein HOH19_05475 [Kordiimonadaceae bacterium]|jgi:hypothetical protein|nr:hypothetical protein [Kordiimonadaceae bacterium]MBT6032005.1 hypothetical protein [Kordiimonadaceae bacterium]